MLPFIRISQDKLKVQTIITHKINCLTCKCKCASHSFIFHFFVNAMVLRHYIKISPRGSASKSIYILVFFHKLYVQINVHAIVSTCGSCSSYIHAEICGNTALYIQNLHQKGEYSHTTAHKHHNSPFSLIKALSVHCQDIFCFDFKKKWVKMPATILQF